MPQSKYLAVDLGAESGRVIVGNLEYGKLKLEEIHRFPNRQILIHGKLCWDVLALFTEIKKGLSIAAQNGHGDIKSIGVDTWGVDFGLIDQQGQLVGNPVAYRDSRTDGMMDRAFNKIPKEEIYKITGIQFMQLNTIFQFLSLVEENNPQLQIANTLLFMPDLFNYLLTGEIAAEYSIASTSQLLDANNKNWADEIFSKLNLPRNLMPDIVKPGTSIGNLLKDIAREVGLEQVKVIAPAGHDTACAVAAIPCQFGNWACLSSGTWSVLGIESEKPIINEQSYEVGFTNEGGVNDTIRFLRNIMGMWLLERCRQSWTNQGLPADYNELLKQAMVAQPFQSIINPDDDRFLNPPDMPDAIAGFCRTTEQTIPETTGNFVRCIFESLAFKYRSVIDMINSLRPVSIDVLHIVGGGSQNKVLNQFTTNALGIPVIAGPVEGTAIGNILMQAISVGEIDSLDTGRKIVADSFSLERFEPQNHDQWNKQYERIKSFFN